MIKIEYLNGRYLEEKEIQFKEATDSILLALSNNIEFIKIIFEVPAIKGVGLHNVTIWDKDNISYEWFNNNFIITDGKNSISINKDANFTIRDKKQSQHAYIIYFSDYNMNFVIDC